MSIHSLIVAVAANAVTAGPAWASGLEPDDRHARPVIVSEQADLVRGETGWVGVSFQIDEGWHLYWPGYNDSGFPPGFDISTNADADIGAVVWPAPHRYPYQSGLLDHVYEDRVTLMFPVTVPSDSKTEYLSVSVESDWLVCEVECVPESGKMALELKVLPAGSESPRTENAGLFEAARRRVPQPWSNRPEGLRNEWRDNTLVIESENAVRMAFYPHETSRAPKDLLQNGESLSGSLAIEFREGNKPARGIVEVWETAERSRLYQLETRPGEHR